MSQNSTSVSKDSSTTTTPFDSDILSTNDRSFHLYSNLDSDPELLPTPRTLPEVWTFMSAQTGPRDIFRDLEDKAAFRGLSFKPEGLWRYNINEYIIRDWLCGSEILLNSTEKVKLFDVDSYASVSLHAELAAAELNRIIKTNKAIKYPINIHSNDPFEVPGLSKAPGHMIFKKSRLRWVTGILLHLISTFILYHISYSYTLFLSTIISLFISTCQNQFT